ncbi:hypothetical protein GQ53DRAFT_802166 [Thozetella sp. PMI_491]|nr:hypothetical protein GQ53DRAFT_802166 [Thozetella sp. PMI_491]
MAGPGTPGSEGPTFPPPSLPRGWVAQWDASSKKYYFVQLATGVSQWETPTDAAPVGGGNTPANHVDHPYGGPPGGKPEVITHPDGSQTVKHADGTMEPIMPGQDGTRGIGGDGPQGERGIGSFLMNQISGNHGGGSHGAGGLANQLLSGLTHAGGNHSSGGGGGSGIGGKLASQLASNLFHSSDKPSAPQNYHGGQTQNQPVNSGGLAGSVMGGVATMFGGKPGGSQNFGYSNSGHAGGYSGPAPPTSYQPPSSGSGSGSYQSSQPPHSSTPSYQSPPPSQPPAQPYGQQQHAQQGQGHNAPYGQPTPPSFPGPPGSQSHTPSYPPPPGQHTPAGQSSYAAAQPNYGTPQGQHQQQGYGQPSYSGQGSYNAPYSNVPPPPAASHSSYPSQPAYGQNYGGQNQY